ncbi:hypothetical protein SAMN05660485_03561 [Blastococcus fimeti]|nr:hypothetical protein SAMN05660485_03561 [Blastococcus fimeti]
MSSPTDPQPPAEPTVPAQPTTQEIPVATPAAGQPAGPAATPAATPQQLPPHPAATTPTPVPTVQKTGPVGFVPGLPGQLPPPPPPAAPAPAETPATATSAWPASLETGPVPPAEEPVDGESAPPAREARDRTALRTLGLVAAALVLLELGLGLRFGGESFWSDIPLWSAFATVCAALGLAGAAGLLPGGRRPGAATTWRIAAAGLVGLAVFWLLVVLPVVASDRGFLLTAALGCLGAALWTGPARTR